MAAEPLAGCERHCIACFTPVSCRAHRTAACTAARGPHARASRCQHAETTTIRGAPPRLLIRTKLAFGVGAVAEGRCSSPSTPSTSSSTTTCSGCSGTLCGLAVTIALVLDAISDPLVGSLSDRLRSRLGRRHPFLYAAPIPLAICFYCIYVPPEGLARRRAVRCGSRLRRAAAPGMTLYHVPHLALGAELTCDYHERSVVMSYNSIFAVVGGAAAFVLRLDLVLGAAAAAARRAAATRGSARASRWSRRSRSSRRRIVTRDQVRAAAQPAPRCRASRCASAAARDRRLPAEPQLPRPDGGLRAAQRDHRHARDLEPVRGAVLLGAAREPAPRRSALRAAPAFLLAFLFTVRLHRRFDKRNSIVGAIAGGGVGATLPVVLRLLGLFPENGSPLLLPLLLLSVFVFAGGIAVLMISLMSALADIADEHELAHRAAAGGRVLCGAHAVREADLGARPRDRRRGDRRDRLSDRRDPGRGAARRAVAARADRGAARVGAGADRDRFSTRATASTASATPRSSASLAGRRAGRMARGKRGRRKRRSESGPRARARAT